MSEAEASLQQKYENSGYVSTRMPETNCCIQMDMKRVFLSQAVTRFVRAFVACNWPWLLATDVDLKQSLADIPHNLLGENGRAFFEKNFATVALCYAVGQAMKESKREDGKHVDGAASLFAGGLTVWGRRHLHVMLASGEEKILVQEPGDFYIGNLCSALHQVHHLDQAGPLFHQTHGDEGNVAQHKAY